MKRHLQTPFWCTAALTLALLAGCNKAPDTAANVADVDVTTNVKTALLQNADLKGFEISVMTVKGDVRLTGVVDTQNQIDAAVRIARGADGAHTIHDELTLKK